MSSDEFNANESGTLDSEVLCEKEVQLMNETYVVYLKRVPTRLAQGGTPTGTTVRAFIKKR